MNKHLLPLLVAAALSACSQQPAETPSKQQAQQTATQAATLTYPETRKGEVVDTYFGTEVADPYRWLEDDRSEETGAWVKAQNQVTFGYLDTIPYRDEIKQRLAALMNYEKVEAPIKAGEHTYFFKNDGLQNQKVLYRVKADGDNEVFLDPNGFSEDGTTSMSKVEFSKDGSKVAYQISEGGSDWRKIIVRDVTTGEMLGQPLVDVKFSEIAWRGDDGFFYSSYDKPTGSELSAKTDQHKVFYHKLGTPQSADELVFGGTEAEKHRYVEAKVTGDDAYLVIKAANSTSGNKLFVKNLSKPSPELVTIFATTDFDSELVDNLGSTLLLKTDLDAPNSRVIAVDADNPEMSKIQDIIAETDNVLEATSAGGFLFGLYKVDAIGKVKQFDKTGKQIREIELPLQGTAKGFKGGAEQTTLYYTLTDYKTPETVYSFDVNSGESKVHHAPDSKFDSDMYTSEQVFYPSKDGTQVPMIITYKKGTELNGNNPTILYGYGGFNISLTPKFKPRIGAWLELGGVYAVANLRGGGEYGKSWHLAGTKMQKQNVFDDFIAAAEYLIDNKYTSSDKLAVRGGSNGGLLVGTVMTQRPELFKVALPAVGVMDMLRYHTFTAGAGWAYDYGTADDNKEMFEYLFGYSPVQNVKLGTHYPATLVTTGDHDDRVVPAHSFKFAAQLQAKQTGENPTLIRIETNAGHGAGTPTSKIIDQYADIYGFTLFNMGVKSL